MKLGRPFVPVALKLLPGAACVDRSQLQQVVELITHVGELSIDIPHSLDNGLPTQGVIVWRVVGGARACELEIGLPQRQTEAAAKCTAQ